MAFLLALLGTLGSGIGSTATTTEPTLPLTLQLREIDSAPRELPESDPLWRVVWLVEISEESVVSPPDVFQWPEFPAVTAGERLPVQSGEKWEPYYTGRLELGYAKIRKMEDEPKFFPAITRAILGVPTGLIEALTTAITPDGVIANDKQVFDQVSHTEDLATIMGRTMLMQEMRFYGSIPRSYLWKFGAQMGTEELDSRRFNRMQIRALFTGVKNAYRERYRIPSLDLDTVLSTVSTGDWVDFIIVPAAVSVFAARFGIDRKIRLHDQLRIDLDIEKGTKFYKVFTSDHSTRLFSMGINVFRLPLSLLVSVKGESGTLGLEFIGIGTDINSALCAIYNHERSRDMMADRERDFVRD